MSALRKNCNIAKNKLGPPTTTPGVICWSGVKTGKKRFVEGYGTIGEPAAAVLDVLKQQGLFKPVSTALRKRALRASYAFRKPCKRSGSQVTISV